MTIRYLVDEDIRAPIVQSLRLREPAIDILDVKTTDMRGTKDPKLLELAAQQGRILISHDRGTMTRDFYNFLESGTTSPGLFIVPQKPEIVGRIIESLLFVWAASQPEEWRDRITYLPLR